MANLTEAGRGQLPKITSAPWNGMHIPSGRILVVGHQGYGDTIQFARYIPMVAERCQEVILGCSVEMLSLLRRIPGITHAHRQWNEIPGHAAYCRLSSLPHLFQTTMISIPSNGPYLHPDPTRVATWAERFAAQLPSDTKRIGLPGVGAPPLPMVVGDPLHCAVRCLWQALGNARSSRCRSPFRCGRRTDRTVPRACRSLGTAD